MNSPTTDTQNEYAAWINVKPNPIKKISPKPLMLVEIRAQIQKIIDQRVKNILNDQNTNYSQQYPFMEDVAESKTLHAPSPYMCLPPSY